YRALQTGPASVVVPIDKLSVLLTVFFSVVVLKEKMSKQAWIGLAIFTGGTLFLLLRF
ncbi:MAG: EamA family transporter, partial [Oscillospiraceae bacterium]